MSHSGEVVVDPEIWRFRKLTLTLSTFLPTLRSFRAAMLLFGLGKLVYGMSFCDLLL